MYDTFGLTIRLFPKCIIPGTSNLALVDAGQNLVALLVLSFFQTHSYTHYFIYCPHSLPFVRWGKMQRHQREYHFKFFSTCFNATFSDFNKLPEIRFMWSIIEQSLQS